MKKKIRNTGEIIDVITYSCGSMKLSSDLINYIDKDGNEKSAHLNYYWDLEDIDDTTGQEEYWKKFRNSSAVKILAGMCANYATHISFEDCKSLVDRSIKIADYLVENLRNNEHD